MSANHKAKVKVNEPMVWLLACQLQTRLALTWTACVVIARDILSDGYEFRRISEDD